jgi:2-phosphosulfolactate phosphatase
MRADVRFTLPEAGFEDLTGVTAVVVDVIRATTTLTTALSHGARAVLPAASTEDALRLAQSLGREDTLLCGERKGLRIEGYDLGNSPLEYSRDVVEDKRLVMNTTNGTRALLAVEDAEAVLALSILNLSAVAAAVRDADRLLVQCAGREGAFALEDAVCAGHLLKRLEEAGVEIEAADGARAARVLADSFHLDEAFLASTRGGVTVAEVGLGADLEWCARLDSVDAVPVLQDRALVLQSEGER